MVDTAFQKLITGKAGKAGVPGGHFSRPILYQYKMTEVVRAQGDHHIASRASDRGYHEDVIEERRKDAEGRVGTFRYIKGKMLGKVGIL